MPPDSIIKRRSSKSPLESSDKRPRLESPPGTIIRELKLCDLTAVAAIAAYNDVIRLHPGSLITVAGEPYIEPQSLPTRLFHMYRCYKKVFDMTFHRPGHPKLGWGIFHTTWKFSGGDGKTQDLGTAQRSEEAMAANGNLLWNVEDPNNPIDSAKTPDDFLQNIDFPLISFVLAEDAVTCRFYSTTLKLRLKPLLASMQAGFAQIRGCALTEWAPGIVEGRHVLITVAQTRKDYYDRREFESHLVEAAMNCCFEKGYETLTVHTARPATVKI